jgi:PAS domain-containing protein
MAARSTLFAGVRERDRAAERTEMAGRTGMPHKEIEVILTRQLASYLAVPVLIVDPAGTLLYFNEPAEAILDRRFDETGEMPAAEWSTIFVPTDETGEPLPPGALPLLTAIAENRPVHRRMRICGLDRVTRHVEVTTFPLVGMAGRCLGAVALFWEASTP